MRCRVFGTVELVDDDGRTLVIGSPNQRVVLAALVAHRGSIVSTLALVDSLWPDDPPASAVPTLRTYVSRLRHHLSDVLHIHPSGYSLALAADQIDCGQFEQLYDQASSSDPATAAEMLQRALEIRRGPAFGSEAGAALVRGEAGRLDELALSARTRLASIELSLFRHDRAVAQAEGLLADVPHLEPAWEVLVSALAQAGRSADALRAFQRAVDALAELGLEPSAALRDAERMVLAPMTSTLRHHRAPSPTTDLVGRTRDLEALDALLERSRLVTVVGAGGVGKTRLVIEFAQRVDGAVWVDLSAVTADSDVASSVLTALGIAADGRTSLAVLTELVHLSTLIVLDNAEQVADGVAEVVTALLAASPHVRVLVTSRERLGVEGEYRWHVAPLLGDGAELFVARAAMSDPASPLQPDDPRVVQLVRRLDSVPLAIEMAAAQLATMTVDELSAQLADGLSALVAPRRAAQRQRDLSSLIQWSERLLQAEELAVLHECSVFAGAVVAGDVAGVIGRDVLGTLRRLAERSLLETERVEGDATSFRMLVTVRDHASAQLRHSGRSSAIGRRHADWFLQQAAAADREMRVGRHQSARDRFESIAAELRAAHRFARREDPSLACRLSTALHTQARYTMFDEPFAWAESMVDEHVDAAPLGAGVWASAAARSIARGDLAQAWHRAQQSMAEADDDRQRMLGLDLAGDAALFDGRLSAAAAVFEELWSTGFDLGEQLFGVVGGVGIAMTQCYGGDERLAEATLDRLSATPDLGPVAAGWIDYTYGEAFAGRDPQRALSHYQQAIDLAGSTRCRFLEGVARVSAGSLQARVGDTGQALQSFSRLISFWLDMGERTHLRTTLRNLAVLLQRADRPSDAAVLLGAIDRDAVDTYDDESRRLDDARQWTVSTLGDDRYETLYAEGAARDIPAAGAWALAMLRAAD